MSHIEGSIGGAGLAQELVFVATAAHRPMGGHAGVRSAMARAAQLLVDPHPVLTARHASTDRAAASLRPARRRTRRYSERHRATA